MSKVLTTGEDARKPARRRPKGVEMKNIVLAYDGSEAAKRALERTADLANGAAVTVVSAVHVMPNVGRAAATTDPDEISERQQGLKDASEFLKAKGVTPHTVETHGMDVADAIVEEARGAEADLLIVGSSGKNLAERVVLGSVSSKVVHHAPCDVMVVR
jgi:nucleotide-binding universal stress UspA family protein